MKFVNPDGSTQLRVRRVCPDHRIPSTPDRAVLTARVLSAGYDLDMNDRGRQQPVGGPVVVVVGVCGSGKTELVRRLRLRGIDARVVAQEHSEVRTLWRHLGTPDAVVYLSARTRTVHRRGRSTLSMTILGEQRRRLADARRIATVRIRTDEVSPEVVEARVIACLDGIPTMKVNEPR